MGDGIRPRWIPAVDGMRIGVYSDGFNLYYGG
ncbi:MAG: hypothetical protein JWM15_3992, partial [Cryptosporangiaceae bacterium]|nr:hypothetical protein [Cryptosporangiaceae bacterium]